jgi:purine-binding chemotaxis protein CheW
MSTAQMVRQLVAFSLGEEEYARPITRVQEIIRYSQPRAVASEASWIRGVISLRGKIIPVCDLAARLGSYTETSESAKIGIIETENGQAGVVVDEVLTIDESHLDGVPTAGEDFIEAIAKIDDRLVVLLNPDGIFAGIQIG